MLGMKTVALAAGLSLAMFGFAAGTATAKDKHHHHNHHNNHHHNHHGNYGEGFGFNFEIPDVYIQSGDNNDGHVSWCYRHKPNYDEDTDMYYSHGYWKPCVAPFD